MAKSKDPSTDLRRAEFRKYCEKNGWKNDDGTWAVVDIAKHFNRKPNQIHNILKDHGSFGPTAANALAQEAGLSDHFFEPGGPGGLSHDAYELARTFDNFLFEDEKSAHAAFNAAIAAMAKYLKPKSAT